LDYDGKCRHLHGHNGRVEIELEGRALDRRGMLADFADIKARMKTWIDENLDHRMILRRDDPAAEYLRARNEPFVALDENPTAEALARLIFSEARRQGFPVVRVTLWETPDSFAVYAEPIARLKAPPGPAGRPGTRARSRRRGGA
jgi:6-pyruvoyltetrahydropterin/6-carboxytetrahydropterin synthase